jgi:hypothetical protein
MINTKYFQAKMQKISGNKAHILLNFGHFENIFLICLTIKSFLEG